MFNFTKIKEKIIFYKNKNFKIFTTSSFQTHSIPLLHMLSQIDNSIPVYFLNTGYHFPETLEFRDSIADQLNLNVINLISSIPKNYQKDEHGRLMFASDPEYCCHLNKVKPLEPILESKDVWINGVRAVQNSNRSNFQVEESAPTGVLRYHPILDWTNRMIFDYRKKYDLPEHPLEKKGYFSIGCEPCTRSSFEENGRSGRWNGMKKNECGLHTELVKKN